MPPIRRADAVRTVRPSPNGSVAMSAEQREAVASLLSFPKRVQTLGGFAGTGKTTVIRELVRHLPGWAVCAFTGKAANVLRRKGVADASTIHSLIYKPADTDEVEDFDDEDDHHEADQDEDGDDHEVEAARRQRQRPQPRPAVRFSLADELPGVRGIVVDEASMVGRKLYDDLTSFGLPLIFVGDHGQLEPVSDGSAFDKSSTPFPAGGLMKSPDLVLETVHRNAGEIARFAEFIRKGNPPCDWAQARRTYLGKLGLLGPAKVRLLTQDEVWEAVALSELDQIIVPFNGLRVRLNQVVRENLGLIYCDDDHHPVPGDRVMCLQNCAPLGLYNGQQGVVGAVAEDEDGIGRGLIRFDVEGRQVWVEHVWQQWNREQRPEFERNSGRLPFDYSYVVTCHKAQGDEWDRVLVFEQRCGAWDHTRWCYTAASRARRRLDWVLE